METEGDALEEAGGTCGSDLDEGEGACGTMGDEGARDGTDGDFGTCGDTGLVDECEAIEGSPGDRVGAGLSAGDVGAVRGIAGGGEAWALTAGRASGLGDVGARMLGV